MPAGGSRVVVFELFAIGVGAFFFGLFGFGCCSRSFPFRFVLFL